MSRVDAVPVIRVLTLFPDMVRSVLETSIMGRAQKQGQVRFEVTDIRDFAVDKHRTVDDTAYGGGAGMIMMAPPVVDAVESCRVREDATVILTSDHGAVQSRRSTLVYGNRETSTNLRHKHGVNLRGEEKDTILIKKPEEWGLPADFLNKNYILAREDFYFVYPTNFHEYERLYRNSFQHGGLAMEEVILPCVILKPR